VRARGPRVLGPYPDGRYARIILAGPGEARENLYLKNRDVATRVQKAIEAMLQTAEAKGFQAGWAAAGGEGEAPAPGSKRPSLHLVDNDCDGR
jgi:hypothetical protein